MISGGSWVFNKKEKGNSNVYACFHLKSQVPTKDIIDQVLFDFLCLGGSKINKISAGNGDRDTHDALVCM